MKIALLSLLFLLTSCASTVDPETGMQRPSFGARLGMAFGKIISGTGTAIGNAAGENAQFQRQQAAERAPEEVYIQSDNGHTDHYTVQKSAMPMPNGGSLYTVQEH